MKSCLLQWSGSRGCVLYLNKLQGVCSRSLHTWKLVHLVLSLKYILFLTWYLDVSGSVRWRTSLGRACRPQSLSNLKEETVKCMDGLGKWGNAALVPLPVGTSQELTECSGGAGYIHLQGQASWKAAAGMILHCSKSGMTCLALKTNTGWSRSQSESLTLPPSVFEWCYCHSSEVIFEHLWLSCRTSYASMFFHFHYFK